MLSRKAAIAPFVALAACAFLAGRSPISHAAESVIGRAAHATCVMRDEAPFSAAPSEGPLEGERLIKRSGPPDGTHNVSLPEVAVTLQAQGDASGAPGIDALCVTDSDETGDAAPLESVAARVVAES